ncbi:sensor histidine kinase DesK [Sporosarcina sp. NCCP-2716]|uniref:sensor histidine kinase n=1 Tax=Sporosarcina sp. NCCP-2716 TaxID=2943679 RepID=UPI00203C2019|nr:sensor histidine kinase [Sporosarcina sp. NCCP-2716]GKV68496.1 sensor histidine kinase DesK [Sporosarcina sp. NCCP-2716]
MDSWYNLFPRNPWLSVYIWVIFCVLPFFFIFRTSEPVSIAIGIIMVFLFFLCYRFSFKSKSGLVYMWVSLEMAITVGLTLLFGYVYLALFTAFFIGNIRRPAGFFIMYGVHIAVTIGAIVAGFFLEIELFLPQVHFLILTLIGVVLLPFNLFNRNKQEKLEGQLEFAQERISELTLVAERQRIARDLHDTLGQKLSLIGLKSDLAGKLIGRDPERAAQEVRDIRQTASIALNEVRELVSTMRAVRLPEELERVRQVLRAAEIEVGVTGTPVYETITPIGENVLSMCLKEAVTNVVKHSFAKRCGITFHPAGDSYAISVIDDGIGFLEGRAALPGNGLEGMRERLEFVNGALRITPAPGGGTELTFSVPSVLKHIVKE